MTNKLLSTDYTIAWISALPLEMAAAKALLDETHEPLPQPRTDQNSYTLGKISGHNIILVCLPSGTYGTVSAATVLAQLLSTFSEIQFGLMVGVGGGVPADGNGSTRGPDIRLMDVVVGMPTGSSGGVIQYDHGKVVRGDYGGVGDGFENTGAFNRPLQALLSAVSQVRSDWDAA
ncbi:nucleoside phosphorylase domain-containing protein [Aspergillus multicolor]|uniref:nucleoside phosphorylase domain-containing protein n=1 Tax=Aspergillus multicolor TaxID=41759 RepID=UPI003CCDCECE